MTGLRTISKIWLMVVVFFYGLLFMLPASAAEVKIPQDCWTQEQCVGQAGNETAKYFFKLGDSTFQTHCKGSNYGKCYITPDEVILSVPIPDVAGGSPLTKVTQFPDYLKKIYTFFVWAIAIVAVAYLGFGGYEWIAAAGSAEQIGKAKDTIQGAIIGLLLALGSWVLLNTINSRLVEFDYIRVERIRPSALAHFCAEAEGSQQWIKVGDNINVKVDAPDTWCNTEYYSSLNTNNTCMGLDCHDGSYCMPKIEATGFECVSLDDVDDRCNDQEGTREACDLFDQYIKTIAVTYPESQMINKTCRLRVDDLSVSLPLTPSIEIGSLQPNECIFTDIQTPSSTPYLQSIYLPPEINSLTYKRINCRDGEIACLEGGSPRVLEYWGTQFPNILTDAQVEVTCTDSNRAGIGTDSICIISQSSVCSVDRPDEISFYAYYRPKNVQPNTPADWLFRDHDHATNIYKEVSCSLYPPINGSCQSGEKCWAIIVDYYDPYY